LVWQDGVTGLTQLTGDQRIGKMFALVAIGQKILKNIFQEVTQPGIKWCMYFNRFYATGHGLNKIRFGWQVMNWPVKMQWIQFEL
jgi:hypothetical protein